MRYLSVAVLLAVATTAAAGSESQANACGGEACDAVIRGFFAFFDRKLAGLEANGRACADCHRVTDHFQLSPASAEARFQLLQKRRQWDRKADDPLFRPIDADDFRAQGTRAHDFSNLRQNGLIRIEFALPANIKLIDPATNAPSAETTAIDNCGYCRARLVCCELTMTWASNGLRPICAPAVLATCSTTAVSA